MSDRIDTEAVKALADSANDGPWEVRRLYDDGLADVWGSGPGVTPYVLSANIAQADAEFIAAARTLVPALCDEVDRLRVALREWDDVAEVWQTDRTHAEVYYAVQNVMRRRAALTEGDAERPERCPTCVKFGYDSGCRNPFHRAADQEGKG